MYIELTQCNYLLIIKILYYNCLKQYKNYHFCSILNVIHFFPEIIVMYYEFCHCTDIITNYNKIIDLIKSFFHKYLPLKYRKEYYS